jgi:DNA-binding PadR family transcriptional regulator
MEQNIMDCLINPIKIKLLLEIHSKGRLTAKQLSEIHGDIPQATLYRYLKRMTGDGVLKVVDENQIRGTIEKTYALAVDLNAGMREMLETNSGEAYMRMFMNFLFSFIKQFQEYCKKPEINLIEDRSGFSVSPIYATDQEMDSSIREYAKIVEVLSNNPATTDRKLRTVGLIIAPPEEYNEA